jgi:hypothetical protein
MKPYGHLSLQHNWFRLSCCFKRHHSNFHQSVCQLNALKFDENPLHLIGNFKDKNSNVLYLQGRKTYLSQLPCPIITCHMGTTSLMTGHLNKKNLIRTKSQMINICSGRLEGLVTSRTKIQMTYICRNERPI